MDTKDLSVSSGNGDDNVPEENRELGLLDSLSFEEMLYRDWGFALAIYPVPSDGDYDMGMLVQRDGEWLAFYDGPYSVLRLVEVKIGEGEADFLLETWAQVADDQGKIIQKTPNMYYAVRLKEVELRDVIQQGLAGTRKNPSVSLSAVLVEDKSIDQ